MMESWGTESRSDTGKTRGTRNTVIGSNNAAAADQINLDNIQFGAAGLFPSLTEPDSWHYGMKIATLAGAHRLSQIS